MSLSPTDLSAQRNAALQAFRDKQQTDSALLREAGTTHLAEVRKGSDGTQVDAQEDQVSLTPQQQAALAAAQAGPPAGAPPPTATGGGDAGPAPVAGPGAATAAPPAATPAQPPLSFDAGGAGNSLLPDPSAALPPGAAPAPAPGTDPTAGGGAPAPTPTGAPTPVPPDNSPLQVAQQVQQVHSMWDQIRSIEAQMDIDDRKTQLDISNMYAAEWQSCMQSAQSNMLAMMAAGHGFAAAFIKNYVST